MKSLQKETKPRNPDKSQPPSSSPRESFASPELLFDVQFSRSCCTASIVARARRVSSRVRAYLQHESAAVPLVSVSALAHREFSVHGR